MEESTLYPGTKVRRKSDGKEGMVVPEFVMPRCQLGGDGYVLVEFDGSTDVAAILLGELELGEYVAVRADHQKCGDCIFYNGQCLRLAAGRMAILLAADETCRVPTRIYPHCQDEKGEGVNEKEKTGRM